MKNKTGILLVNLGTPDSPHPRDVYRYLTEFLTDGRVIDTSWIYRQLLVRGVIVPLRYRQSVRMYKEIWTSEGSPLKVYGYRLCKSLQKKLGEAYCVELAMRYQNPSIFEVLMNMRKAMIDKLLIFPMFPQYASATTGSVHQKIMEIVSQWEVIPEITFINHFSTHPSFIQALGAVASPYNIGSYDHILFSFHGLPQRHIRNADKKEHCLKSKDCCLKISSLNQGCYSAQCNATASSIANYLNLTKEQFSISFQSRLGRDPWLQPYTSEVITNLAQQGKKRILVFCPAFVCDCLETLYEIGVEYAAEFKHAGGEYLDLVPGLNDHPKWVDAVFDIITERLKC